MPSQQPFTVYVQSSSNCTRDCAQSCLCFKPGTLSGRVIRRPYSDIPHDSPTEACLHLRWDLLMQPRVLGAHHAKQAPTACQWCRCNCL